MVAILFIEFIHIEVKKNAIIGLAVLKLSNFKFDLVCY